MRVLVITPPAPIVTLAEAKAHLRVLHDDENTLITAMVAAATESIDGPNDGWLGRAIGPQELEARGRFFDQRSFYVPFPPMISVTSVKYLDPDGAEQTAPVDRYEVRGNEIVLAWGKAWPAVRSDDENVRVRYRAGYVMDPEADPLVAAVPAPIKAAILLMTGDLYSNRETTISGTIVQQVPMSTTVENLLTPYRIWN